MTENKDKEILDRMHNISDDAEKELKEAHKEIADLQRIITDERRVRVGNEKAQNSIIGKQVKEIAELKAQVELNGMTLKRQATNQRELWDRACKAQYAKDCLHPNTGLAEYQP